MVIRTEPHLAAHDHGDASQITGPGIYCMRINGI
jgi:hypothetical protein